MCLKQQSYPSPKQSGSALVIAVFIIVVMSILAAVLVRVLISGSQATLDEVYGARAFHAANSGAQIFIASDVMPILSDDSETLNPNLCHGLAEDDSTVLNEVFTITGLAGYQARVWCEIIDIPAYNTQVIRIKSTGSYSGAESEPGRLSYSRTILVEALNEQL